MRRLPPASVALALFMAIPACAAHSQEADEDESGSAIETGSRYLTPLKDGFYETDGLRLRLFTAGSRQKFVLDFGDPRQPDLETCSGSVSAGLIDRLRIDLDGERASRADGKTLPPCSFRGDILSYDGLVLTARATDATYSQLSRRRTDRLREKYQSTGDNTPPTKLDITASDDRGISFAFARDGAAFAGAALWDDAATPVVGAFTALVSTSNACRVGMTPRRAYDQNVISGFAIDVADSPAGCSGFAGSYGRRLR